ncbi:hypothetical protein HID58_083729 [Brassica napus]|uniref:BnaC08g42590D protein n=2 Tax=Brassica napus TaxID=3708 RepID=A0A078G833_BRANA|nr:hypothetical protein HID58_083729 [Brassica napus]CAF2116056.1 unnamed protein product [Brassica napus]CDY22625.1 BnaC08g42590D [Brassica napus]
MFGMKFFILAVFALTSCVAKPTTRELYEEDLKLERQLKLINKPSVNTVKTEYGDIYDCIDFYKQPAFDHALLKSHEFHPEMRPSNMNGLEEVGKEEEKEEGDNEIEVECPHGTVPIRRTTKEDLIRQKTFNQMFDSNIHPLTDSEPGNRVISKYVDMDFGGGFAHFSLYQTPNVHQLQFSSGLIKVSNGTDFIKAGWTVNPTLYGDNRCRKFAYFHTRDQHCFNTNCPGFVIVNNNSPLDYAFPKVSEIAVRIMECRFYIYRDPQNGNWWLVTGKGKKQKALGFWPAKLFTDLAYNADEVYWGGELFTIPNSKTSPMGNGLLIKHVDDPRLYAYARDCSVVDAKTQKAIGVAEVNSEEVTDFDGWYGRRKAHIEKYWGHTIMFGGPAKLIKGN